MSNLFVDIPLKARWIRSDPPVDPIREICHCGSFRYFFKVHYSNFYFYKRKTSIDPRIFHWNDLFDFGNISIQIWRGEFNVADKF